MAKKVEIEQTEIEAPYELPEGWKWVKGESLFKPMERTLPKGDYFSYIDIESIDNINQTVSSPKQIPCKNAPSRASRKLHAGDTVFSMVRPYLKNIAYIDSSLADSIASTGFFVCTPRESVDGRYVYNLMKSPYVVDGLNALMKGDNSPSIRKSDIEGFSFPLPPTLAEQKRIVSRIETLFAKLDEAEEKTRAVLDSFETRKAAILHKAFTGELTANWRKANGVADDSWISINMGTLSELITKGASPKWQGIQYTDDSSQTLFVTSENVREGYLNFEKEKYLDNKINEIQKRSVLKKGDVLLNIVGASIGRSAIYNLDKLANINQAVCIIRLNKTVLGEFVCYFLNSNIAKTYYDDNKVETARANISLANVSDMIVPVPSLPEQQEIVRILDSLLEKEFRAKEAAQSVLDQIALLKKSILARAFRGEI